MNRFGYLRDRLFMVSLGAYAVNRLVILPHLGGYVRTHVSWAWPFLHSHFDDLLLMPAALPVILWLQRLGGLRAHDQPPDAREVLFHLAIWSVMCKLLGPVWLHIGIADPWDVLFFAAGGGIAWLWWNRQPSQLSRSRP